MEWRRQNGNEKNKRMKDKNIYMRTKKEIEKQKGN